jgi:hypothetical protein
VEHEPRIQQLSDDLEKQDLHPFHLPIGVRLTQDAHGRATRDSVCIRCDRVDGFPCLVGGKTDAQVICVDPALAHEKFALRTGAHVTRLETDPGGRTATAVVAELNDPDAPRNDRHPAGLANGSGVVGWHYMRHNNLAMIAVSKDPNPTRRPQAYICPVQVIRTSCRPDDERSDRRGPQVVGETVEVDQQQAEARGHGDSGHRDADVRDEVVAHPAQQRERENEGACNVASTAFCNRSRCHRRMYRGDSAPVASLHDQDADRHDEPEQRDRPDDGRAHAARRRGGIRPDGRRRTAPSSTRAPCARSPPSNPPSSGSTHMLPFRSCRSSNRAAYGITGATNVSRHRGRARPRRVPLLLRTAPRPGAGPRHRLRLLPLQPRKLLRRKVCTEVPAPARPDNGPDGQRDT